eukprot:8685567-Ditylum_brightwellii.AAC.1
MPGVLAIGGKTIVEKDLCILTINISDHPYFTEPPKLFQAPLLLKGRALVLEISECEYYLLPFVIKSKAGFPFHKYTSSDYRINSWVLIIDNIEPDSAEKSSPLLDSYNKRKTTSQSTSTLLKEVQRQQRLTLMRTDIFSSK